MNDPNIPIIGEPFVVVLWYPTAITYCKCMKGRINLVITTGMGNPASCGGCGKMYMNEKLDPATGAIVVTVMIPRAPSDTVM